MSPGSAIRVGSCLRQSMLGSDAVYTVLAVSDDLITVEVVVAPGLKAGTQMRLTADAVRAMKLEDPPVQLAT